MTSLAGHPIERTHRVSLLVNGVASYSAMLDLVKRSQREILLENFIFRSDAIGAGFAGALRERADQGVAVRVLHDPFGSLMSRRLPIGFQFHRSPVMVRSYNPPRPTRAFLRWGRDHRKVLVQDGLRCVVGGLCLADVWVGNCISSCTWRDSAVLVEGTATATVAAEFETMWSRGRSFTPSWGGRTRHLRPGAFTPAASGEVPVRIVGDRRGARTIEGILAAVFDAAESEILVTNPYFLPTAPLAQALSSAARRGVEVRVLIPRSNNHGLAGLAIEHELEGFLESGVKICQWLGPLIHAKTVVVDRVWSMVGSSNLDPLSLRKNSELNVEIHGPSFGNQMAAAFEADCAMSRPLTLEHHRRRTGPRRLAGALASLTRAWL